MKKKLISIAVIVSVYTSSCKKFLEIDAPFTTVNQENVYKNDNTAAAVLTGIYTKMMNDFFSGGITSTSLLLELSADNLVLNNINDISYLGWWQNNLTPDYFNNGGFNNYFSNFYPIIYTTNSAIEGLNNSSTLTASVKNRLLGEAYFIRAFYYFYLTNLFGDAPLILTTDYSKSSVASRSAVSDIYKQMTSDLQKSISLLTDDYVDASIINNTSERCRPNLSTAMALLARIQLYAKNYSEAEALATTIINKTNLYSLINPGSVFQKNSQETIWSLQPVKQGYNTDEASVFLLTDIPGTVGSKNFYLSSSLISKFEPGDQRLESWIGIYENGTNRYPYSQKYKADLNTVVTEYCIVFRLSELYLVRAESRTELSNISGAQEDLDVIRDRAGLPATNAKTQDELRQAILQERRVELFTEWGHRWLDLKRTGKLNIAMQEAMQYKGGSWEPYKSLFPIPNTEIIVNKNITQNSGY